MYITSPISYPLSLLIDKILGEQHESRFNNEDLKELIHLHTTKSLANMNIHEVEKGKAKLIEEDSSTALEIESSLGLQDEQARLMQGIINLTTSKVSDIMIPFDKIFSIGYEEKLTLIKIGLMLENRFSKIFVYSGHSQKRIIGYITINQLIGIDYDNEPSLKGEKIKIKIPHFISPSEDLMDSLKLLKKSGSSIALVSNKPDDLKVIFNRNSQFEQDSNFPEILGLLSVGDIMEKVVNIDEVNEETHAKGKILSDFVVKQIAQGFIKKEGFKIGSIIKAKNPKNKEDLNNEETALLNKPRTETELKEKLI